MNLNGERVATVSAFLTVGFSFDDEQECMHLNPERKGPVKRREDWR